MHFHEMKMHLYIIIYNSISNIFNNQDNIVLNHNIFNIKNNKCINNNNKFNIAYGSFLLLICNSNNNKFNN